MKVFIVEDDPIIVEGLKIALTQESYEVESYGNITARHTMTCASLTLIFRMVMVIRYVRL